MERLKEHKAWLSFVRKLLAVPAGYSKEDLSLFLNIAERETPSVAPIIHYYIRLIERSESPVRQKQTRRNSKSEMHLFDLLREKKFFPQNLDLARFAGRVMPHMRSFRFDKMSRSDIAARIIEHMEESDPRARVALERSMRQALSELSTGSERERKSFLSKWENIIKGIEL